MTGVLAVVAAGGAFVVTVSPDTASGFGSVSNITTNPVTVSQSETGSYTYAWVKISGGAVFASSPTSGITIFNAPGMGVGEQRDAIYACDVTKAGGATVRSPQVSVSVERA